jgi:hypothetical protein
MRPRAFIRYKARKRRSRIGFCITLRTTPNWLASGSAEKGDGMMRK